MNESVFLFVFERFWTEEDFHLMNRTFYRMIHRLFKNKENQKIIVPLSIEITLNIPWINGKNCICRWDNFQGGNTKTIPLWQSVQFNRFHWNCHVLITCVTCMRSFPYCSQHTHMCYCLRADYQSESKSLNWIFDLNE